MTALSLYTLSNEVERLLSGDDAYDAETGELSPALLEALEATKDKGANVAAYILNMGAQLDAMTEHMLRIKERHEALANKQEKLREYLQANMKRTGISEIDANDGTFRVKLQIERDASVEVFEEGLLPPDFLREVPAKYAPDKKLIGQALKEGHDVPGARIVKRDRLTIS